MSISREIIVADFESYWNKYGSLNIYSKNNPEQDNGNALGYAAHYYSILSRNGLVEDTDRFKLQNAVNAYWKESGLLNRKPNDPWYQAFDDYEFVCHAAHMIGLTQIPEQIVQYGRKHWWYFNNTPDQTLRGKNFFGRLPNFVAHVKICSGRKPNLFERLYWCLGLYMGANKDYTNCSGKVREFMYIQNYERSGFKCWFMDKAVISWRNRMNKIYPSLQMGEVLTVYFSQLPWLKKYYEGVL